MNRRAFLQNSLGSAVALNAFPIQSFWEKRKKSATDRILLGPKKVELSRLGQGSGTNGVGGSSNQTRKLGFNGVAELYRACYDNGITFWDSADQYWNAPASTGSAQDSSA